MMKKEYIEPACEVVRLKTGGALLVASLVVEVESGEVTDGWADARLTDDFDLTY